MRKLITAAFVSLDGVMQAPGGSREDPDGGFHHGGWVAPYSHAVTAKGTAENFGRPYDLVLGRRTYDIFAAYWPHVNVDPDSSPFAAVMMEIANAFNGATKYVASRTRSEFEWRNSRWLGKDPVAAIRDLKQGDGPDLLTQGSSDFLQTLLGADLIDEFRLLIFPLTLGTGKRLFGSGTLPMGFSLVRTVTSPTGVIVASYERAGDVRTGSFDL